MTRLRQSSASSFAARLVEPTRSQNITVIGRRSAASVDEDKGAGLVGFAAGSVAPRLGDRLEQALAVSERHAELFEVGIRQVAQDLGVDLVLAKYGLVLAESEAS